MPKIKVVQLSLILLLTSLILISRLGGSGEAAEKIPPLEESIDRIEIAGPGVKSLAVRDSSGWKVGEKGYPADERGMIRMADSLRTLKADHLVSRMGDFERYGLTEESRIMVTAFDGDRLLRTLRIGKESESGTGCYFSLEDRPEIYFSRENLKAVFNRTEDSLRNREMLALTLAEVIAVRVKGPSGSYTLERSGEGREEGWVIPELGIPADTEKTEQFLSQLVRINASGFPEEAPPPPESAPWSFQLKSESRNRTLYLFRELEKKRGNYLALTSESPYPFTISSYKAEELLKEISWFAPEQ